MMLLHLIRGTPPVRQFATVTPAAVATPKGNHGPSVATVATVSVARPESKKHDGETRLSRPLSTGEEQAVRRWLDHIHETDHDTIEMVLEQCRTDPEAKAYFLKRAGETQGDR